MDPLIIHTDKIRYDNDWSKQSLINDAVKNLPAKYDYIFCVEPNVVFNNKYWLTDSVYKLETNAFVQPYQYAIKLGKDQNPSNTPSGTLLYMTSNKSGIQSCRSFASSAFWAKDKNSKNYGHPGLAWGMQRDVLDVLPLYEEAPENFESIMAHAAIGQFNPTAISQYPTDKKLAIKEWSKAFHQITQGRIGFATDDLHQLWDGQEKQSDAKNEFFDSVKTKTKKQDNHKPAAEEKQKPKTNDDYFAHGHFNDNNIFTRDDYSSSPSTSSSSSSQDDSKYDDFWHRQQFDSFGGGQSGGGGAGGSWSDDNSYSSDSSSSYNND